LVYTQLQPTPLTNPFNNRQHQKTAIMTKPPANTELMNAVEISEPGGPDVLRLVEIEIPSPAADEVRIKVAAAGVNRPDCLQRRGLYPAPPGASELPGLEVSGVIDALGSNVDDLAIGDKVCALLAGGGYAEYCVAPAVQCLPAPVGMSLRDAAGIPETFFTVWTNVFDRGELQAGEKLLVHGGASGIGTTAIQLASALGAEVYATAGSDAKVELCEQLGARHAVNYQTADFLPVIKDLTADAGVNLIFDIVGGAYLEQNVKLLAPDGRLVVIGVLGGAKGTLNLGLVLSKRLKITGSTLRARSATTKGAIGESLRRRVWPLLEQGRVAPVIQATWPLQDAARAHELLEANAATGKVLLIVDEQLADQVVAA
jgi:NADPH2:quinone reductase